ncbi:hypothetical protein LCGC14_1226050 [marine sediment metagenome]|uniref:Uncharacterized protein n=1 Tax=marine sediment metagenome TaxID=412755 RepID=A0A0F9NS68_9ZZZZ
MEYSLTLTAVEVNYILTVLNQRPYAEVEALIPKIIQQTKTQREPTTEAE